MLLMKPVRWAVDLATIGALLAAGGWIYARQQTLSHDPQAQEAHIEPYTIDGLSYAATTYLPADVQTALRAAGGRFSGR